VVPISKAQRVDLLSGVGLATAVAGCDTVIDVTNVVTTRRRTAVDFFSRATQNLLDAGQRAGVRHHVVLSIVGVDVVDYGYYEGKLLQEELVRSSSTPHTVLRATQFHEFAEQMVERMRFGPVAAIPKFRCQPVAAIEVAELLAEIAQAGPQWSGGATMADLAGPEEWTLPSMVSRLKRARGDRTLMVPVGIPGKAGQLIQQGALLPAGDHHRGAVTFGDWVDDRYQRSAREVARASSRFGPSKSAGGGPS
jgi:uncharacterized protein YbjT (DUF2867 family)